MAFVVNPLLQHLAVAEDMLVELFYPVLTLVVGCDGGNRREWVDITHLMDVDGAVNPPAQCRVGTDNVGHLKSCYVEGLGCGYARSGMVESLCRNGGERDVGVAWHDELVVDLIGDDVDMVPQADVCDPQQFLPGPYAASRVVGVAEDICHDLWVGALLLKAGPVEMVFAVFTHQKRGFRHLASDVADTGEETIIDGSGDKHLVARHGQCLDDAGDGRHNTDGVLNPFAADVPAVAARKPANHGVVVFVGHLCVGEDAVRRTTVDGFNNRIGGLEVHVGYPHGNHTWLGGVPFHTATTPAGYDGVEIISSVVHDCLVWVSMVLLQVSFFEFSDSLGTSFSSLLSSPAFPGF